MDKSILNEKWISRAGAENIVKATEQSLSDSGSALSNQIYLTDYFTVFLNLGSWENSFYSIKHSTSSFRAWTWNAACLLKKEERSFEEEFLFCIIDGESFCASVLLYYLNAIHV